MAAIVESNVPNLNPSSPANPNVHQVIFLGRRFHKIELSTLQHILIGFFKCDAVDLFSNEKIGIAGLLDLYFL